MNKKEVTTIRVSKEVANILNEIRERYSLKNLDVVLKKLLEKADNDL